MRTVLALSESPNHSEPPIGRALRYGEGTRIDTPMYGRTDRPRFRPRRMRVVSNPGITPPTPHYSPVESINALKTIGQGLQHPNNSGNAGGVTNVMPGLYAAGGSSHGVGRRLADQNDRYWQGKRVLTCGGWRLPGNIMGP